MNPVGAIHESPAAPESRRPRYCAKTPVPVVGAGDPGREQVPSPLWLQMLPRSICLTRRAPAARSKRSEFRFPHSALTFYRFQGSTPLRHFFFCWKKKRLAKKNRQGAEEPPPAPPEDFGTAALSPKSEGFPPSPSALAPRCVPVGFLAPSSSQDTMIVPIPP